MDKDAIKAFLVALATANGHPAPAEYADAVIFHLENPAPAAAPAEPESEEVDATDADPAPAPDADAPADPQ